ncbi:MAG: chorismate synthase [bacterium]
MLGKTIKVELFGESHGPAIGCVVTGLPAGERIDLETLQRFLNRRRPGASPLATARREADAPRILSGLTEGVTNGAPLAAVIENADTRSGDYDGFRDTPRPGHADYTALLRYGQGAELRGGGHFSGRLTAPLCLAGGIALQLLARRGIHVGAHLLAVGEAEDEPFPLWPEPALFARLAETSLPALSEAAAARMEAEILTARAAGDSVGGLIEGCILGLPGGLGGPWDEGLESAIAAALFAVPAVKGVEFGAGFRAARMRGSRHNDPFFFDETGAVRTRTNHAGGLLGGITTGMPLVFRAAIKPTPSIALEQETVSLSRKESAALTIRGRHDPCIAPRAVPVVEAAAALCALDAVFTQKGDIV